jgi:CxxC motif-containing protein
LENTILCCTVCPRECTITVALEGKKIKSVTGNTCSKGADYANKELFNPQRTLTSTVRILGGTQMLLPVRSQIPIPRNMLISCMQKIRDTTVTAPIKLGDVVIENILETGANIVASRDIEMA